jgi:CRISPR-associated protein Cmr1
MTERKTLTVTLETVTPLFLGGAELRGTPELRPPTIRGVLRYWLRAALGGVIGDDNLAGLHRLESAVFGSTDSGSPIYIRLRGSLRSSDEKILPHKEGKSAGPRKAFIAGQSIDLILSQLRSNDETVWQVACSALNLALTFGGIGLRSRRGHGTLKIVKSSNPVLVPSAPTTLEDWKQHTMDVAEKAIATTRDLAQAREVPLANLPSGPARYPCATHSGLVRIYQPGDPKPALAMDAVTQFMRQASGNYAFGGIKPRQASPLWVRPIQLEDHYGLLLTILASQFNGANYGMIRDFLNEKFAGEDITVKGWNA